MKKLPGINALSGIDKLLVSSPVWVGKLGIEGDEHDLTFHGGPDKAILGYCCAHYPDWRKSFPDRADRFVPGGFGENFVTAHMNERNVCIGDIVQFGEHLQLQVSLPRQPYYKLNHRFKLSNFAPETYHTSRTGWYYGVVREGAVAAGNEVRLAAVEALGEESRGMFRRRVVKAHHRRRRRSSSSISSKQEVWRTFKIVARRNETPRVVSLQLEAVDWDTESSGLLLGAHARLKLGNGLVRTYSIVSSDAEAGTSNRFELGVALDENSRGGSQYIHQDVHVGDEIQVGRLTTDIKHGVMASNHVYIAGGIGIAGLLAVMQKVYQVNYSLEVHYAVRSAAEAAFLDRMSAFRDRVRVYDKSEGERMEIARIVGTLPWNSKLYVCGPRRMMDAVKAAADVNGLSHADVHYEAFGADTTGDAFDVDVIDGNGKENKTLRVGEDESLLEVLRREYRDVPSSCEVGNYSTCKITLRSGRVLHKGSALEPDEQKDSMLSCVSRGIGKIVVQV